MAIYSAYLPPDASGETALTGFQLVPEGKAIFALLFPVVWLAVKRLWLALLIYLVLTVLLVMVVNWYPGLPVMYLAALPGLYLLLEGNELVRKKLERNGWQYAGVVDADNRHDAEAKFICSNTKLFASLPSQHANQSASAAKNFRLTSVHPHSVPAGLFPE